MTCPQLANDIPLYDYGELTQEEEERLEQHMAVCPACAAQLASFRRMRQALLGAEAPVPDYLLAECRAGLKRSLAAELAVSPEPRATLAAGWKEKLQQFMGMHIGFRIPAGALALLALGFLGGKLVPGVLPFPGFNTAQQAGFVSVRSVEPDGAGQVRIAFDNVSEKTVLGSPDDPKIRQLLLASMKDESNAGLRVEAAGIIKDHAADAGIRNALLDAIQRDPNVGVRMNALEGLKQYGADPDVRKALTAVLLNDANPGVRVKAIDLLTAHKDEAMVGPLQNAMRKEDNGYVRMRMTNALREMNASVGTF